MRQDAAWRVAYDFSQVPEEEIYACAEWELSRSVEQFRQYTERERQSWRERDLLGSKPHQSRDNFVPAYMYFLEWPGIPFTLLPKKKKAEWIDAEWNVRAPLEPIESADLNDLIAFAGNEAERLGCSQNEAAKKYFDSIDLSGSIQNVVLRIDWRCSDSVLKQRFAEWLTSGVRPPDIPQESTEGARNPPRQLRHRLKQLSAYRLLEHFQSWESALLSSKEVLGEPGLYSDHEQNWRRAHREVEIFLRQWWRSFSLYKGIIFELVDHLPPALASVPIAALIFESSYLFADSESNG